MRADTEYLTTHDLAQRWKMSTWTVRDYARRGLIAGAERAGRRFRFRATATLAECPAASTERVVARTASFFDEFDRRLARTRSA